ncbi:uncharacterized protein LOC108664933 isoform X2 [Hyalella azteca]|nr:uncharacterized protein LOC108664933 isoform X2 [Hyalella azteca]
MVKKLLMHADKRCINMESRDRSTALLLLCRNCSASELEEEILASLLDAGANPNLPKNDLPLFCALERSWWRGAELILDAGADARATDSADLSATFFALDNFEILMKLLSRGAGCSHINDWITGESLTDAQLKTILPYILSDPEINESLVMVDAASVSYHESAMYILEHCVFDTTHEFEFIIDGIFQLDNGINWADKNKYITAITKNIFMSEVGKDDLLTLLFVNCTWCCLSRKACCCSCNVSFEQIWINLEHILGLAEHNGLPIEKWSPSKERFETVFITTLPPIKKSKGPEIDRNVLNLVLYRTTLCSVPLVLKLLPLMKQKGFRLTMSSAAAFLSSQCIREQSLKKTDVDIQAIVHSPESPYRVLLSEVTRNCCEEGQCWFRSPRMTDLFRRGIAAGHHFLVLMLLHLGVHELFLYPYETDITWARADSRRLVYSIVHRYAPRWKLRTPTPSGSSCDDEMRSLENCCRPENVMARLNQTAPLRSLQELCRLSIRASLGHCRIEEKTEGLRDVLPAPLREYLYFRHDFLIFPSIPQLSEEDEYFVS